MEKNTEKIGVRFEDRMPLYILVFLFILLWFAAASMASTSPMIFGLIIAVAVLYLIVTFTIMDQKLSCYEQLVKSDLSAETKLHNLNMVTEVSISWVEETQYYKDNLKRFHKEADED